MPSQPVAAARTPSCASLREAKVLIIQWRRNYNTVRPHSSWAIDLPPLKL